VVGPVDRDQIVDERAGVRPPLERPPRGHAALAVPEDRDPPAGPRRHRADRVHDVFGGHLDIAHPVAWDRHRAPRATLGGEDLLVVPAEVDLRGERRARYQQHGCRPGRGEVAVARDRTRKRRDRHVEARSRGAGRGRERRHGPRDQHAHDDEPEALPHLGNIPLGTRTRAAAPSRLERWIACAARDCASARRLTAIRRRRIVHRIT
jgi:hypothetical protein